MDSINKLIATLEEWFKKLPALPANVVDSLVSFAPWIVLIFGVLGILGGISAFGALSFLSPFARMAGYTGFGTASIAGITLIVSSIILLMAYPGLNARKKSGWMLLFWGELVNVVAVILSLSFGGIIGVLIGFYLLFKVKSRYH